MFSNNYSKTFFKIPVLREKPVSLHVLKKERDKKNEPNKKENLKNILVDGLHKCFGWLVLQRPIHIFICIGAFGPSKPFVHKRCFQNPCFERKTFSLHVLKKEREKKNDPNKKENLKNILMDGLHKSFWSWVVQMFWLTGCTNVFVQKRFSKTLFWEKKLFLCMSFKKRERKRMIQIKKKIWKIF